jgi:hypothetical protein
LQVNLALFNAGATVTHFPRHLDHVSAFLPLFHLYGSKFIFRQWLGAKIDALGCLKRPKNLGAPLDLVGERCSFFKMPLQAIE